MTKIHIIGGSGSGKTYIAEELSRILDIPRYDLDSIFWDHSMKQYGIKNDPQKRDELLNEIFHNDSWLIEGVYYGWLNQSFLEADYIFVLMPNVYLRDVRIIKRYIKRKLTSEPSFKNETIRSIYELLKRNHNYDRDNLPKALQMLKMYSNKVFILKNNHEILKYFY